KEPGGRARHAVLPCAPVPPWTLDADVEDEAERGRCRGPRDCEFRSLIPCQRLHDQWNLDQRRHRRMEGAPVLVVTGPTEEVREGAVEDLGTRIEQAHAEVVRHGVDA